MDLMGNVKCKFMFGLLGTSKLSIQNDYIAFPSDRRSKMSNRLVVERDWHTHILLDERSLAQKPKIFNCNVQPQKGKAVGLQWLSTVNSEWTVNVTSVSFQRIEPNSRIKWNENILRVNHQSSPANHVWLRSRRRRRPKPLQRQQRPPWRLPPWKRQPWRRPTAKMGFDQLFFSIQISKTSPKNGEKTKMADMFFYGHKSKKNI